MTVGSANLFPYVTLVEGSSPSNPAATDHRLYVDSADKLFKWRDSAGTVRLATGQPLGLTGAVSATRYVGGTASVAPTTGTFGIGDFVITQAGGIYVCTVAGTPGTWVAVSGGGGSPPGYEFDYAQITSPVSPTAITEATANTVVTGNAVTYDGSTVVMVEFYAPYLYVSGAAHELGIYLYDGASSIGNLGSFVTQNNASDAYIPGATLSRRLTPSNAAHTYSIRARRGANTYAVTIAAGAGGSAADMPAFMRITKV